MSKIWREKADPKIHRDFMSTANEGGIPVESNRDNLIEKWVYMAQVNSFVFQFISLEQVKECMQYFEQKVHPSTKDSHPAYEHYWHPWYCKLPKGINKEKNRQQVLKLLGQILQRWGD